MIVTASAVLATESPSVVTASAASPVIITTAVVEIAVVVRRRSGSGRIIDYNSSRS